MTIVEYLNEKFGIPDARPSKMVKCPYCNKFRFTVKKDLSVGKCFHIKCGKYITACELQSDSRSGLGRILKQICEDFHKELCQVVNDGYRYLYEERGIHQKVIYDSFIGTVPTNYDFEALFKEEFSYLQNKSNELLKKLSETKGKKEQDRLNREIEGINHAKKNMEEKMQALIDCVKYNAGWIVFFHTDRNMEITKIRIRKSYSKEFRTIVFVNGGVFGLPLTGFNGNHSEYQHMLATEGEVNSLQLQSAWLRKLEAEGKDLDNENYRECISFGSAFDADYKTLKELDKCPVIAYDRDDAGLEVLEKAMDSMYFTAFAVPEPSNDLDEFIRSSEDNPISVFEKIENLIASASQYYRHFLAVKKEVDDVRSLDGRKEFLNNQDSAAIILGDLNARGKFYKCNNLSYFFNKQNKKLHLICNKSLAQILLLSNYGINQSEPIYNYITNAMIVEGQINGKESEIQQLSYFDQDIYTLYIYNNASQVYKVSPDAIELKDNGVDGVLFLDKPNWEPFKMVQLQDSKSHFSEQIVDPINLADDKMTPDERKLLFRYWVYCLFFESCMKTKPIMCFYGEKGSGKSISVRKVGMVFQGKDFEVTPLGEKQDDFDAAVSNSRYLVVDNADSKCHWFEDKLAILSTGGSFKRREYYTTNDLVEFKPHCFLAITTRTPHFRRDDIADRLIVMKVQRFEKFKSENELLGNVINHRDEIITEIIYDLQKVVHKMKETSQETYEGHSRMADFGQFITKAAKALGKEKEVLNILEKLSEIQAAFSVETDIVFELLSQWAENNGNCYITNTELFIALAKIAGDQGLWFPYKNHRSFAQKMKGMRTNLSTFFDIEERNVGSNVVKWRFKLKPDKSEIRSTTEEKAKTNAANAENFLTQKFNPYVDSKYRMTIEDKLF